MSEYNFIHKKLEGYLLDLREYPETMYMDVYGNGTKCWDRLEPCHADVVFRAKYIRADIVAAIKHDAFEKGVEAGRNLDECS